MITVKTDFSQRKGRIKPMNAVNNGPVGLPVRKTGNFETYRAAGFPYARLHDSSFCSEYGGEFSVDVHRIFRNFDADSDDPASYIFAPTDAYLSNIAATGTKIFYRLGASIEHLYKFGTYPPKDFLKWAKICEHIIRHYNEGWANGFFFGIEYWEIWNEFDCRNSDGTSPCWQGSLDEFAEFYSVAARYLKEKFPHLKIGGPAFSSVWGAPEVTETFFKVMRRDKVPIDFLSYHAYMRTVQDFCATVAHANEIFTAYGYGSAEKILNEWNYIKGWAGDSWHYSLHVDKSLKGASFAAACMAEGQKADLDMLMYYDARPCEMNGLFGTDFFERLKGYYAFKAFSALRELGTCVHTETEEEDIHACAATDGNTHRLCFTRFRDEDVTESETVKVAVNGVSGPVKATVYAVDECRDLTPLREEIFTSNEFGLYLEAELFGIYLIEIAPVRSCGGENGFANPI